VSSSFCRFNEFRFLSPYLQYDHPVTGLLTYGVDGQEVATVQLRIRAVPMLKDPSHLGILPDRLLLPKFIVYSSFMQEAMAFPKLLRSPARLLLDKFKYCSLHDLPNDIGAMAFSKLLRSPARLFFGQIQVLQFAQSS
jgi:hypothetical protein